MRGIRSKEPFRLRTRSRRKGPGCRWIQRCLGARRSGRSRGRRHSSWSRGCGLRLHFLGYRLSWLFCGGLRCRLRFFSYGFFCRSFFGRRLFSCGFFCRSFLGCYLFSRLFGCGFFCRSFFGGYFFHCFFGRSLLSSFLGRSGLLYRGFFCRAFFRCGFFRSFLGSCHGALLHVNELFLKAPNLQTRLRVERFIGAFSKLLDADEFLTRPFEKARAQQIFSAQ
jgi:hypothetical protein